MGEIAEMMLEGELCEQCGTYIKGPSPGYPRKCNDCKPAFIKTNVPAKVVCPHCKKRVKRAGLKDHLRVVHQMSS